MYDRVKCVQVRCASDGSPFNALANTPAYGAQYLAVGGVTALALPFRIGVGIVLIIPIIFMGYIQGLSIKTDHWQLNLDARKSLSMILV